MTMQSAFHPPSDPAWQTLTALAKSAPSVQQAMDDADWRSQSSMAGAELTLDLTHHRLSGDIWQHLIALLAASPFEALRQGLLTGQPINHTEDRAVGHTRIRTPEFVSQDPTLNAIKIFSEGVRSGRLQSATGQAFQSVINIGIGGSDLGPKMVCEALREHEEGGLAVHFVANVDGAEIKRVVALCDPETTLVIIASKTFTTQETMMNARSARNWLCEHLGGEQRIAPHLVALTTAREKAVEFGVGPDQIFSFDEDIGGRYSLWSSIGLTIALQSSFARFEALLNGAHAMDRHFSETPPERNLPVALALLAVWYSNFLGAQSQAVIPYCERLNLFPDFLQQLDMESLGKRVDRQGQVLDYTTGLVTWGQTGTNGQHAFFQLLHQGTRLVPLDFIGIKQDPQSTVEAHRALNLNLAAQVTALAQGRANQDLHRDYPGNKPSSVIILDTLSPHQLGALIALYEHKVFTLSALWHINAFDQWGVELGKSLATAFDQSTYDQHPATATLLDRLSLE
jgi:glucose-6-phosphate isomerase